MAYVIYQITFLSDNAIYIGQTSQELHDRIGEHLSNSSNTGVRSRMRRGMKFRTKVLDHAPTLAEARRLERAYIERAKRKPGIILLNED